MKSERILSLDISTKLGYCLATSSDEGFKLETYGQSPKIEYPKVPYPVGYVMWAEQCFSNILKLIKEHKPTILVIEETAANSKSSHSQKILEWIHFLVASHIRDTKIDSVYLMTGTWRKAVESKMTKEERLRNKAVKDQKEKTGKKLAYGQDGKVMGKVTKKHVAIRTVKQLFDLDFKMKDNDLADAILIAYARHKLKESEDSLCKEIL